MSQDSTYRLRELMQTVDLLSFRALSKAAGVSEQQIRHLRRGEVANLRVGTLLKLSQALQVPITELLSLPTNSETQNSKLKTQNSPSSSPSPSELSALQQEYDRLQQQLVQQRQTLWQEFQQASVQTLESLLLQLPTAAYAAQQNPQAPAIKLLPLLRPLDRLLADWGIESIAAVGAEIPYDPQHHQLMAGTAQASDQVRVRYTGYRQGDRLLYRAKVSPIEA